MRNLHESLFWRCVEEEIFFLSNFENIVSIVHRALFSTFFKGDPMGGHINNYLLEKSRVIHQQPGDNNFHSFYQLLKGGPDNLLKTLKLNRDGSHYRYLSSNNNKVTLPPKVSFL